MELSSKKRFSKNEKVTSLESLSLILGFLSCVMFGVLTGIPAVILGHVSLYKAKKESDSHKNKRVVIAAIILGYFGIFLNVMLALALFMIYYDPNNYWYIL